MGTHVPGSDRPRSTRVCGAFVRGACPAGECPMGASVRTPGSELQSSATTLKAVVPCQNKIVLKNFRPPSVDRPKIILFQHGATSKMILKNFSVLF